MGGIIQVLDIAGFRYEDLLGITTTAYTEVPGPPVGNIPIYFAAEPPLGPKTS